MNEEKDHHIISAELKTINPATEEVINRYEIITKNK